MKRQAEHCAAIPPGRDPGPIGIVHFGLGPIGIAVAAACAQRRGLVSVAAVDNDPTLVGCALHSLLRAGNSAVHVTDSIHTALASKGARAVAHCTGSSLADVAPQLLECLDAGLSVVSTCEELSYPWVAAPELARQLDAAARRRGVALLGTGVNPGFVMDFLPIVLSAVCRRVDRIVVHRVQEAGNRRVPLQRKIGAGLSVETFTKRAGAGQVRHVGLAESAHAIAGALGWKLTELKCAVDPVLAEVSTPSGVGDITAGAVKGVRQVATGWICQRLVLRLELEMAVGLANPRDEVEIHGDPDVRLVIPGGLHGDIATAAIVANSLAQIVTLPAGLRTMAEVPPPHA